MSTEYTSSEDRTANIILYIILIGLIVCSAFMIKSEYFSQQEYQNSDDVRTIIATIQSVKEEAYEVKDTDDNRKTGCQYNALYAFDIDGVTHTISHTFSNPVHLGRTDEFTVYKDSEGNYNEVFSPLITYIIFGAIIFLH